MVSRKKNQNNCRRRLKRADHEGGSIKNADFIYKLDKKWGKKSLLKLIFCPNSINVCPLRGRTAGGRSAAMTALKFTLTSVRRAIKSPAAGSPAADAHAA